MPFGSKTSWQFGQVDKRVLAADVVDQAVGGAEILLNDMGRDSRSSKKRFGTRYKGQPASTTATARVFFFRLAGIADFIVEVSNLKMRFWKDGVLVLNGGSPYELTSPYATADLDGLQVRQTATRLWFVHPDYMPRYLTRTTDTSWTISQIDNTDGPWLIDREQSDSMRTVPINKYSVVEGYLAHVLASADIFVDAAGPTGDRYALLFLNNGWLKLSGTSAHFKSDGTSVLFCTVLDTPTDPYDMFDDTFTWEGPFREESSETGVNITVIEAVSGGGYANGAQVKLTGGGAVFTAAQDEGRIMDIDSSGTARTQYVLIESVESTTVAYGRIISGITATGTGTDSRFLIAASQTNTIYATWDESAGTLVMSSAYYESAHADGAGALFYYQGGILRVTAYNSTTSVDVEIVARPNSEAPTPFWKESAWNEVRKYPNTITIHQNRLVLGGYEGSPHTFNGSKPASRQESVYENFDVGDGAANDALDFDLDAGNAIKWMISSGDLLIGTDIAEYTITSQGGALTASDNSKVIQSTVGGANVPAIQIGRWVLFVGRDGKSIYSLEYSELSQSNIPQRITKWSEDLFAESAIKSLDYTRAPYPMLLALRSDGTIISIAYDPDNQLLAPRKWSTGDSVESLVVAPGSSGDEIWMVVKRGSEYFVELLDFSLQMDSSEITTPASGVVSGLHFADATSVRVWDLDAERDLGVHTVTSGGFTINSGYVPTGEVEVGIAISYRNKFPVQVIQDQKGYSTGRVTRLNDARLYLVSSNGGTINGKTIPFKQNSPYSGQINCAPIGSLSGAEPSYIDIQQSTADPFELVRVVTRMQAGD